MPRAAAKYAAFFRNVNLGRPGKPTRMQIEAAFAAAGVVAESFLATGNVVFAAASETKARRVLEQARAALRETCGLTEPACLRSLARLTELADLAPFVAVRAEDVHEYCISFFATAPASRPALPLRAPRGDLEIFRFEEAEAFGLTRLVSGRPGNVNGLLERLLAVPVTTRNWNTVRRILERHG